MGRLRWVAAKMKADAARAAEKAARRKAARIAKKVARVAAETDGLSALPLDVAVGIELNEPVKPEPAPDPTAMDDSVPALVSRLTAIRERIWRLQAMFAVSLSHDCLMEANQYLTIFQSIAEKLKAKDAAALEALTLGHESLLLSPPIAVKQSIPLSTQNLVETRWLAMTQPTRRPPKPPVVSDGLDWLLT
jgi:hypothetical protein